MHEMTSAIAAIFAKPQVPGEAKTRLSPSLPPHLAAELHAGMVADAVDAALQSEADRILLFWASDPTGKHSVDLPQGVTSRTQEGPDLGSRLAGAFGELLRASGRVVVIGTDCPDLDPDTLREAFAALAAHDLVLGPARDGGYYLIGLARLAPELFTGIEWGSDQVLEQTLERARRLGLRVHLLETLEDLDTPADLVRFIGRRSIEGRTVGLRTESALREMGLLP